MLVAERFHSLSSYLAWMVVAGKQSIACVRWVYMCSELIGQLPQRYRWTVELWWWVADWLNWPGGLWIFMMDSMNSSRLSSFFIVRTTIGWRTWFHVSSSSFQSGSFQLWMDRLVSSLVGNVRKVEWASDLFPRGKYSSSILYLQKLTVLAPPHFCLKGMVCG